MDDMNFILMKVCNEVENKIKIMNLIIVVGYLGFGKIVII